MQKNILITGASGFIGSFLVEAAIARGYRVFAGIRASSNRQWLTHPGIHFIELNLDNRHQLEMALQQTAQQFGRMDFIIHAAGLTRSLDHFAFTKVNFGGTQNMVEALQNSLLVPEKFVFISSLASYGPGAGDRQPIHAGRLQNPVTAYGKSKLLAEQFLYHQKDFPFVIVNPTAVYGPRDKDFLQVIQTMRKGMELYIGTKKQVLSFVHVADLVNAVCLAMESPALRTNLLVSDLVNYTAAEMNDIIRNVLSRKTVPLVVPVWVASMAAALSEYAGRIGGRTPLLNRERMKEFSAINWGVDAAAIAALGYQPQYTLEEGLRNTIKWYEEHQWF